MDERMTLEQVRDWHNEEVRRLNKSQHPFPNGSTVLQALAEHHQAMADAIDALLALPSQAVDDAAIGRAYKRWYAAAKGYENIIADVSHETIMSAALMEKGNG